MDYSLGVRKVGVEFGLNKNSKKNYKIRHGVNQGYSVQLRTDHKLQLILTTKMHSDTHL